MASIISKHSVQIEWGQCDPAGIVFYPRYFEIIEHSTTVLFQTVLGIKKKQIQDRYAGDMPLGGVTAKFLAQLRYGDDVVVESGIEEFRRSSFDVRHRIVKDGTLCVEALETRIWIGYDANGAMTSQPIPEEVRTRFFAV